MILVRLTGLSFLDNTRFRITQTTEIENTIRLIELPNKNIVIAPICFVIIVQTSDRVLLINILVTVFQLYMAYLYIVNIYYLKKTSNLSLVQLFE